jgi:small subunit ribosomal protein S14
MAKTSKIAKNDQRKETVAKFNTVRLELKELIRNPKTNPDDREAATMRLQKLPRDASPTRIRNRCAMTGRARAYYRKFGLSRIALRELGLEGKLPGVRKSSW